MNTIRRVDKITPSKKLSFSKSDLQNIKQHSALQNSDSKLAGESFSDVLEKTKNKQKSLNKS